jgi:hypothetical protein
MRILGRVVLISNFDARLCAHRPELVEGHRPELVEGHRPELAER